MRHYTIRLRRDPANLERQLTRQYADILGDDPARSTDEERHKAAMRLVDRLARETRRPAAEVLEEVQRKCRNLRRERES